MTQEESVARVTSRYPAAELSPTQFEEFVVGLLDATATQVEDLRVTLHETLAGVDGTYDIDATVRFSLGGMQFLVLVEAKKHRHPIKRELVQVLHSKVMSVGAHKGAMVSTAPYQSGALAYARTHGVALATVTEGRFIYETKSLKGAPKLTREEALARYGLPEFVGHAYSAGDTASSTRVTLLSPEHPHLIAETLFGIPDEDA